MLSSWNGVQERAKIERSFDSATSGERTSCRSSRAFETPNGILMRRCFRLLNAKSMGLTITLADITEKELRVMELIQAEKQEQAADKETKIRMPSPSRDFCSASSRGGRGVR